MGGCPTVRGTFVGSEDYGIWGSILVSPCFGNLPLLSNSRFFRVHQTTAAIRASTSTANCDSQLSLSMENVLRVPRHTSLQNRASMHGAALKEKKPF